MTASRPVFVDITQAGSDDRPRLAALYGADFSALSITPARGDRAPGAVRARHVDELQRRQGRQRATLPDQRAWEHAILQTGEVPREQHPVRGLRVPA